MREKELGWVRGGVGEKGRVLVWEGGVGMGRGLWVLW